MDPLLWEAGAFHPLFWCLRKHRGEYQPRQHFLRGSRVKMRERDWPFPIVSRTTLEDDQIPGEAGP